MSYKAHITPEQELDIVRQIDEGIYLYRIYTQYRTSPDRIKDIYRKITGNDVPPRIHKPKIGHRQLTDEDIDRYQPILLALSKKYQNVPNVHSIVIRQIESVIQDFNYIRRMISYYDFMSVCKYSLCALLQSWNNDGKCKEKTYILGYLGFHILGELGLTTTTKIKKMMGKDRYETDAVEDIAWVPGKEDVDLEVQDWISVYAKDEEEKNILSLLAAGHFHKEIARRLNTTTHYINKIINKIRKRIEDEKNSCSNR